MFCKCLVRFVLCCCCALHLGATAEQRRSKCVCTIMPCLQSATRESYHVDFALCRESHRDGVVPQFSLRWAVKDSLRCISCCSHLQQVRERREERDFCHLAVAAIQHEHNGKCPLSHILGLGSSKVQ